MNKVFRFMAVFAVMLTVVSVRAQEVSPVDFMRLNPYQMNANPATDLPYESVMSLVIGNIGLNVDNTGLLYDNCFDFDAQGRPEIINLRKLANSMKEWEIDGKTVETVSDFILGGSKITADGDCSHEIKRHCLEGKL